MMESGKGSKNMFYIDVVNETANQLRAVRLDYTPISVLYKRCEPREMDLSSILGRVETVVNSMTSSKTLAVDDVFFYQRRTEFDNGSIVLNLPSKAELFAIVCLEGNACILLQSEEKKRISKNTMLFGPKQRKIEVNCKKFVLFILSHRMLKYFI